MAQVELTCDLIPFLMSYVQINHSLIAHTTSEAPLLEKLGIVRGPTASRSAAVLIGLEHGARVVTPPGCLQLRRALTVDVRGAPDVVAISGRRGEVHGDVEAVDEGDVVEKSWPAYWFRREFCEVSGGEAVGVQARRPPQSPVWQWPGQRGRRSSRFAPDAAPGVPGATVRARIGWVAGGDRPPATAAAQTV
ncbi:uncharacterized protein A4U43_C03F6370 [Asparagus officinalis]|uniref:Uncharacterized protein n=1 Tax=Asparagus officinalis TaxID=4686 RepID=A0A5P1FD28_ASPOF|nr:uncharacterized protein A4U43_C03F6370 [Asparagus officinalis]